MVELVFWILGFLFGFLLGLIPSMHINNFLPLLLLLAYEFKMSGIDFVIFISSMSASFLFSSFINSYFIGAVNEENFIGVLPSHKLLMKGKGMLALRITLTSALISAFFSFLLVFFTMNFYRELYEYIRPKVWILLLYFLVFEIFTQKHKIKTIIAIVLSSLLGFVVVNFPWQNPEGLLFPMLTGLFALPNLAISYKQKIKIPKQNTKIQLKISKEFIATNFIGTLAGIAAGFLPAIGTAQLTILTQSIIGNSLVNFLALTGSIIMANEFFSLVSVYLVGNPRSGASVAIAKYTKMNLAMVYFAMMSLFLTSVISFLLSLKLASKYIRFVEKLNYAKLSLTVICFIVLMVFVFSGAFGILVLVSSFLIGLLTLKLGVRRSTNMFCLIFPSITFFTGLDQILLKVLEI